MDKLVDMIRAMKHLLPPLEDIRTALREKRRADVVAMAELAGLSVPAVMKFRYGATASPSYELIRALLPHMDVTVTKVVQQVVKRG